MTCEDALESISAALDGELTAERQAELDAHLARCPACAALFEELAGHSRLLRELDCEVPAGLSERILSALPEQPAAQKRAPFRWRRYGTLAACLALVIWAGIALPGRFGKADSMSAETDAVPCEAVPSAAVTEDRTAREQPAAYAMPPFSDAARPVPDGSESAAADDAPVSGSTDQETGSIPGADQRKLTSAGGTPAVENSPVEEASPAEDAEEDAGDHAFCAPAVRHLLL